MKRLNEVSETALITLMSRVTESERKEPIIQDPVARICLDRLTPLLSPEVQTRLIHKKLPSALTSHVALRARKYDVYCRSFLEHNPEGMVVSLGCGFDTRYWRISQVPWRYVEIDLPEVIDAKKTALGDRVDYPMMGISVLDETWLRKIAELQSRNLLLLAEGLFVYLPPDGVRNIFKKMSETFSNTQIVFEVIHKKYTRGIWKKIVEKKMKRSLDISAGSSYDFGLRTASELEDFGENLKVLEEWSYFEDDDIRPKFLKLFRRMKAFNRTQWTIRASMG